MRRRRTKHTSSLKEKKRRVRREIPEELREVLRPIILPRDLSDDLLDLEDSDAYVLYCFYYQEAIWQKIHSIWCTTGYAAKGLGWTENRVSKARRLLLENGFIRVKKQKHEKNGDFQKSYTIICRMYSVVSVTGDTISDIRLERSTLKGDINARSSKEELPEKNNTHFVRNSSKINAAVSPRKRRQRSDSVAIAQVGRDGRRSVIEGNTVVPKTKLKLTPEEKFDIKAADQLMNIVKRLRRQPNRQLKVHPWRKAISDLRRIDGIPMLVIQTVLDWYDKHCQDEFVQILYYPENVCKKWPGLMATRWRWQKKHPGNEVEKVDTDWVVHKDLGNDEYESISYPSYESPKYVPGSIEGLDKQEPTRTHTKSQDIVYASDPCPFDDCPPEKKRGPKKKKIKSNLNPKKHPKLKSNKKTEK